MKPAPFDYHRPASIVEAVQLLGALPEAKILAGGQSLVPLLSMRLAQPAHLIDINGLTELDYIRVVDGWVRIGALARHRAVETSAAAAAQPLLARALEHVAHPTIRNRGTVVGSLVHADPAGELGAVLAVLSGVVRLVGPAGEREVAAADFFLGPLESATAPDELAVEVRVPVAGDGECSAFVELARRHGDYALCGVAAVTGPVHGRRIGVIGVAPTPLVLELSDRADVAAAVREQVHPTADIHATAEYRRHLAGVLAERALAAAQPSAA